MSLEHVGWNAIWQNTFLSIAEDGHVPARISREYRGGYAVLTESCERMAEVSGRFRHCACGRSAFPAVGDWVALEVPDAQSGCIIHHLLPRYSSFVRKAAGSTADEQVVAANVDTVFLVSGLDHDFNPRRIERYLTLAYESGAEPIIVLNKADIAADLENARVKTESIAYGVPVLTVSATHSAGLDALWFYLKPGRTGALLGSSGVGKSSLINALLGREAYKTNTVREHDSHGRHTTTHRQLVPLPNGAVLIDTPGMRELQLLADDASLSRSFDEIGGLSEGCRFCDCTHIAEPGCAVLAALEAGTLDSERYDSYLRQRKEIRHHQIEQDIHLQIAEKNRWKVIHKSMRHHHKGNRPDSR